MVRRKSGSSSVNFLKALLCGFSGLEMPPTEFVKHASGRKRKKASGDNTAMNWIPGGRKNVYIKMPSSHETPTKKARLQDGEGESSSSTSSSTSSCSTPSTSDMSSDDEANSPSTSDMSSDDEANSPSTSDMSSDDEANSPSTNDIGTDDETKQVEDKSNKAAKKTGARRGTKTTFKEILALEAEEEDVYVYCEGCRTLYKDDCPTHPLTVIEDTPVPPKCKQHAKRTLPHGLVIRKAGIKGAGKGVWAKESFPRGVRFGPYGGDIVKKELKGRKSGYAWEIFHDKQRVHYINGKHKRISNWMRYVNCARNEAEQNLIAYQYRGQIYYRSIKEILPGQELLVYYGEEYARELGIEEYKFVDDGEIHECELCATAYTSKLFLLKHFKYRHHQSVDLTAFHTKNSPMKNKSLCKVIPSDKPFTSDKGVTVNGIQRKSTIGVNRLRVSVYLTRLDFPSCEKFVTSRCNLEERFKENVESGKGKKTVAVKKSSKIGQNGSIPQPQWRFKVKAADQNGIVPQYKLNIKAQAKSKIKTIKGEYLCDVCGKKLNYPMDLIRHKRVHTGEKPFACDTCGQRFSQKANLQRHEATHTQIKPFVCMECGHAFVQHEHLMVHHKKHKKERPFACQHCGMRFKQKSNCNQHERLQHVFKQQKLGVKLEVVEEKKHTDGGNVRFRELGLVPSPNRLEANKMKIKAMKGKYQCKQCSKEFQFPMDLMKHQRIHTGSKPFQCDTCGKGFAQNANLRRHRRIHKDIKPFVCRQCGHAFVQRIHLVTHQLQHTGEKPLQCQHCGKRFVQLSNLSAHIRTHSPDKKYKCNYCPSAFSDYANIKCHERIHTGEKPFKCTMCDKAFMRPGDRTKHFRRHTGEKPYICPVCGKRYSIISNLKKHCSSQVCFSHLM